MAPNFRPPPFHRVTLLLIAVMLALGTVGTALAGAGFKPSAQERHGLVAEVDGMINPVTQRFISRAIKKGEKDGAEIVIIKLDTLGGLLSSTEKIVKDLLSDRVITVVYVYPPGGGATSAGTFITAAANVAVMAPATNIGAAAPVSSGGEDIEDTLKSKVVQHTLALMRGIAEERGRNAEALQDTVTEPEPKSYDAEQAVELRVVDFIAKNMDDLLEQLDGRTVETASWTRTLNTRDLHLREINMTVIEKFLFFLADPNVSFLLLSLGGLGLVIEFFNPGIIFPGVIGVILLILAFVSLGNLPVNWAAAGFILLAGALVVAELFVAGFGILGIAAIVSFVLGGLLLFSSFGTPSPTLPSVRVSLWLLGSLSGAFTLFGIWFIRTAVQSRRTEVRPEPVPSPLIGIVGTANTDLTPRGTVQVESEVWTAVSEDGNVIESGERVRVLKVEGNILTVARVEDQTA